MTFLKKKKSLKEALEKAGKERTALGQFNFSTLEQLHGIALASEKARFPVICGTSQGEADFFGVEEASLLVKNLRQKKGVPLFLNFDHGKDFDQLKKAIDVGYDMVHFDGSQLPFEKNIENTRQVVNYAKKKGVLVEGEVGSIGGKSVVSREEVREFTLTSIDKIAKFIRETGVDCIALDIGSVHGIHKKMPRIYPERVSQLLENIFCFVVLHGGSGLEDKDVKEVIAKGVVKVNINTEIRYAWKEALAKEMQNDPQEIVPYKLLSSSRAAVCEKVAEKINLFRSTGSR